MLMKQSIRQFIIDFAVCIALLFAALFSAGAASAQDVAPPPAHPLRLVLARNSTVPMAYVMKDVSERCPGVTLTTNAQHSDYMLYAGGWSGQYSFMVIAKGGDTLYATRTVMLGNAVKDVCKFLARQP
jgi:hypothetical protein